MGQDTLAGPNQASAMAPDRSAHCSVFLVDFPGLIQEPFE
jgi:hypothetical protein